MKLNANDNYCDIQIAVAEEILVNIARMATRLNVELGKADTIPTSLWLQTEVIHNDGVLRIIPATQRLIETFQQIQDDAVDWLDSIHAAKQSAKENAVAARSELINT